MTKTLIVRSLFSQSIGRFMKQNFKYHRWLDSSWLPSLLLMVVAFLAYSNIFGHPWIYDDKPVIVDNLDITSWKAFLNDSYPGRPLRELSYLLDYSLFGMEPAGWHIQNNFWHGLNGILLFLLGRHLFGSNLPALLAALLFLLHPLQVEVVGHLSHRKDLLATTFALASMLSYALFFTSIGRKRWVWLSLTIVLAVLAYAGSAACQSIWFGQPWSRTAKDILDGVIYGHITAGIFCWFWP